MSVNAGGVVYGTILVATLLDAESASQQTYAGTVGAVLIAIALYWLMIGYVHFTGDRAKGRGHFELRGYARALLEEIGVIYGDLAPLAALLICWMIGATLATAVSAAVWTAAGIIVATEIFLGVRSRLDGRELIVQTAFGVLFGVGIIGLRVLLHH